MDISKTSSLPYQGKDKVCVYTTASNPICGITLCLLLLTTTVLIRGDPGYRLYGFEFENLP